MEMLGVAELKWLAGLGWNRGLLAQVSPDELLHPIKCTAAGFKGEETEETVFELTYNWGRDSYKKGDGYAQAAIGTDVRWIGRRLTAWTR